LNFQEIINSEGIKHIFLQVGEKQFRSFEAENWNPNYISFLRQLSEENPEDPHYVAWVEAGNNPEDFWTQQEDFEIAHDTLPSEEETKIETDLGE